MDLSESRAIFENMNQSLGGFYQLARSGQFELEELREIIQNSSRYSDTKEIGEGGMKTIILSEDKVTERSIARAYLRKDESPENIRQFIKEVRITAALQHPNITPIYDMGVENDRLYFTMKLIEGENLGEILKQLSKGNPLYQEKYSLPVLLNIFLKNL